MSKHIVKIGRRWHYQRSVPVEYRAIEKRKLVKFSLKTDSEIVALKKAEEKDRELVRLWESRLRGDISNEDLQQRYKEIVRLAKHHGFVYQTEAELVETASVEELLARVDKINNLKVDGRLTDSDINAVLGGMEVPDISFAEACETAVKEALFQTKKNEDQQRKFRNPRLKSLRNLLTVIEGDPGFGGVTKQHAMQLREWWKDRITDEGLTANSANKDFTHLSKMYDEYCDLNMLTLENPFKVKRFKEEENTRPPYTNDHVRGVLMDPANFATHDPLSYAVFMIMVETGGGANEILGLEPDDINLKANIPHIHIRPNETRSLKTSQRPRKTPLVGVSLHYMRKYPGGFGAKAKQPDQFSSRLNKYMRENGLDLSPAHSIYSMRHNFSDRIKRQKVPQYLYDALMGHKLKGERYGEGPDLQTKFEVLASASFPFSLA